MRVPAPLPLPVNADPVLRGWRDTLQSDGSVLSATAAVALTPTDDLVLADATAAAFAVTLPKASENKGKEFTIARTNVGANAVTITAASGDTINGAASVALGAQYASRTVRSSGGAIWIVIASV